MRAPGLHPFALEWGGLYRSFLVHVPAEEQGHGLLPVVLLFHGAGGTAEWMLAETGLAAAADAAGFLLVVPEGVPPHPGQPPLFLRNPPTWNDGSPWDHAAGRTTNDVGFVAALLDVVRSEFAVDETRIYATGFSNGAGFVFLLAQEFSLTLAAVAPIAGYCWQEQPRLARPVPTLYLVGTADPLVPLEEGRVTTPWGHTEDRRAVGQTLEKWARALGCPPEPRVIADTEGLRETIYGPAPNGADMRAYFIDGHGHHWPGGRGGLKERLAGRNVRRLVANDVIWEFFVQHPRQ
jgi:polyhydroxybutyrate depolymerase